MKLLLDQNISYRIIKHLPSTITATHVTNEGLVNSADFEIWQFAKSNGYTIVTQDTDFNDIFIVHGFPPKIIWFKTGNLKNNHILEYLVANFEELLNFLQDPELGVYEIYSFTADN